MEIQLVPRKALPAVRTIVRSTKPSIGHITALEKIQNAQQTIDKFSQFSNKLEGISKLNKTLDSLKYFSYPNNQLERLSEQLNPINRISKLMSQIQTKQKSLVDATKYQNLLTQSVQSLSIFRNELAHNTENLTAVSKPAYTLEDEDE
ncbi:MAG: hypothetical protein HRU28_18895 [Rhizobiales bacterium]|nr:hypothetical protein [Hyphomicrobiales bacterium]